MQALLCLARNASPEDIDAIQTGLVSEYGGKYTALHYLAQPRGWGKSTADRAALDEIAKHFPELERSKGRLLQEWASESGSRGADGGGWERWSGDDESMAAEHGR